MYIGDWVKVLETESTKDIPETIGKVYQVKEFHGTRPVIITENNDRYNLNECEYEIVPEIARAEYIIKQVIKGTDEETQEGYFKYLSGLFDWEFIQEYTDRVKYLENRIKELEG